MQKAGMDLDQQNYGKLLASLKEEIRTSRIKAHLAVNKEMICLYWRIGKDILDRQEKLGWGSKVIDNISKDLRKEFPEIKGLSTKNLLYMQTFAKSYSDYQLTQQFVAQIPWGHNCVIMDSIPDHNQRIWYIRKTIENGWSRNVLVLQIKTNLHERESKSINNFKLTLPAQQSDLAVSIMGQIGL